MSDTFQDLHDQLLSSYKKDITMSEQINQEMAEAHELEALPVNPDQLTEDKEFVQSEADVGTESEETLVQ